MYSHILVYLFCELNKYGSKLSIVFNCCYFIIKTHQLSPKCIQIISHPNTKLYQQADKCTQTFKPVVYQSCCTTGFFIKEMLLPYNTTSV